MAIQSSLDHHVAQLASAAQTISSFEQSNGFAKASVNGESQDGALSSSAPQPVREARQTVIESAMKIQQLAVGPNEYLPYLALNVRTQFFIPSKILHDMSFSLVKDKISLLKKQERIKLSVECWIF